MEGGIEGEHCVALRLGTIRRDASEDAAHDRSLVLSRAHAGGSSTEACPLHS